MFRTWAEFVVRRPVQVLLSVLLLTGVLGSQARHLRMDIREADQLPQNHPYVQLYNRINDRFGGGAIAVIGLVVKQGDIFNRDALARIERITRKVEALPEVAQGSVLSIASARVKSLQGTAEGVEVHTLMTTVPESEQALRQLRTDLFRDDLYVGTLVSTDARAAAVIVETPVDVHYPTLHRELEEIVAPEKSEGTQIVLAGGPIVMSYLDRYTAQMAILFPIAVLIIALVHYEAFRTLQAMFLPLVTALLSVAWALGIMGAARAPIDTWSAVAPVAILAVAAGHAVQVLKRYYEEYAKRKDNRQAVISSIEKVGPVMVTAGLIASAGFASLATFRVTSVRVFGLLMGCGIISALIIEMTFIPACRTLLSGPKRREALRERESRWLAPVLQALSKQVLHRPWGVLGIAGLLVAASLGGVVSLRVDSSLRNYFSSNSTFRKDDAVINERFAGASVLKVLLQGKAEGTLEQPEVLRAVEDLQTFLKRFPEMGKTVSVADYVKRMHKAMNPEGAQSAAIPDRQALVAQYLFLYSLSGQPDDLSSLVNPTYQDGVILGFSRSDEAAFVHALIHDLKEFAAQRFKDLPVSVGIAGGSLGAQAALNEVIVREKIRNMVQVTIIIFLLSALALRSFVGALFVLTPLVIAVIVNLGVMGWTHTWLSMSTAAVTAMGVSIGADFAIYLIFRLREELREYDLVQGVQRTLLTSGKAIFFVSSAVTLGYLILVFSGFAAWIHLGGLTALIMTVSSLAAVSVLPALIIIVRPRFIEQARSSADAGKPPSPPLRRTAA
jgi:hydrophobe/amphiphile efflux-3 (HAE3) family protein